jgi:hypothetical protein
VKALNITGAFMVLVCNLVVSYNHSIQLFQSGGFSGWMAHVAVIGAETTFIIGALNIVVSRLKGHPPGVPSILAGLLGVGLVSWSNVSAGWGYGLTGVLLGLATPASLVIAEAMISRVILQSKSKTGKAVKDNNNNNNKDKDKTTKTKRTTRKTTRKQTKIDPAEFESVKQVALKILKEEGKLPRRPRLEKEANCDEPVARQVLDKLKKELKELKQQQLKQGA